MLRAPTAAPRQLEGRTLTGDGPPGDGAALVQSRPSLGNLQRVKHGRVAVLRSAIDFLGASAALAVVLIQSGSPAWPAIPLAPLLLIGLSQVLGLYGSPDNLVNRTVGLHGRPVVGRLVTTALFTWTASLLLASHGSGIGVIGQLALWIAAFALGSLGGMAAAPIARRIEHVERWLVVGDDETVERLRAYEPLRAHARIVHSVPPPGPDAGSAGRSRDRPCGWSTRTERIASSSPREAWTTRAWWR